MAQSRLFWKVHTAPATKKRQEKEKTESISEDLAVEETAVTNEVEDVSELLNIEALEVEIGYGLIPLADESSGGDLLQRISL